MVSAKPSSNLAVNQPARLSVHNETIMGLIRGHVAPIKSAAIAGILFAEQMDNRADQITKLRDAIDFLVVEIRNLSEE